MTSSASPPPRTPSGARPDRVAASDPRHLDRGPPSRRPSREKSHDALRPRPSRRSRRSRHVRGSFRAGDRGRARAGRGPGRQHGLHVRVRGVLLGRTDQVRHRRRLRGGVHARQVHRRARRVHLRRFGDGHLPRLRVPLLQRGLVPERRAAVHLHGGLAGGVHGEFCASEFYQCPNDPNNAVETPPPPPAFATYQGLHLRVQGDVPRACARCSTRARRTMRTARSLVEVHACPDPGTHTERVGGSVAATYAGVVPAPPPPPAAAPRSSGVTVTAKSTEMPTYAAALIAILVTGLVGTVVGIFVHRKVQAERGFRCGEVRRARREARRPATDREWRLRSADVTLRVFVATRKLACTPRRARVARLRRRRRSCVTRICDTRTIRS